MSKSKTNFTFVHNFKIDCMKTHFLFPNLFLRIGWILFIPSFLFLLNIAAIDDSIVYSLFDVKIYALYYDDFLGHESGFFKKIENNIGDEIFVIGMILGGILIGFSKLKSEDEMISKIRYESLVWATYLNYGIIIFLTIFIYGVSYYNILMYNTFTLILFFILRFHYKIYKLNKATLDD